MLASTPLRFLLRRLEIGINLCYTRTAPHLAGGIIAAHPPEDHHCSARSLQSGIAGWTRSRMCRVLGRLDSMPA